MRTITDLPSHLTAAHLVDRRTMFLREQEQDCRERMVVKKNQLHLLQIAT
jgi:hypothetical protein